MALKKYKPTTPGQRYKLISSYDDITTGTPEKSLLEPIKSTGGRNNQGRRAMRYIGGGHKQRYRTIDWKRDKEGIPATVNSIEYDPNRTARIALLHYVDGEKRYIIAPHGLKLGQQVLSGKGTSPEIGNTLYLREVPFGTIIHNIELRPGEGATRMILQTCKATIGMVSNTDHNLESHGKAGRNRWLGRRPRVRGVVMNPVDHPMGGGEGKASGGHPRSRKGKYAKGQKTRSRTKASNKYIIERRKK